MSRVGQAFMWTNGTWAVVTESGQPPRRVGSTARGDEGKHTPDVLVHTLAMFTGDGTTWWPIERREDTVAKWELEGRRLA